MIEKLQMETLILCEDREFKQRVVSFMNSIDFHAQKIAVNEISNAESKLKDNPKLLNLIIDGHLFNETLNDNFEKLKDLCVKQELRALLYITEEQMKIFRFNEHALSNLFIHVLPFQKIAFIEAFHDSRERLDEKEQQVKSVPAFEATGHVRDTIEMINILDKNREALDQLTSIGQKFNGFVGTFSYFVNKEGFKELRDLAQSIDFIAKHYQRHNELKKISDEHYDLLVNSAKCAFKILQALRECRDLPAGVLETASQLQEDFENRDDIEKREQFSQDDVDDLLSKAFS